MAWRAGLDGYHSVVLRPEDIERFRRMKPEERLKTGLDLTDAAWRFLLRLPPEEIQRRLDLGRKPWNVPEDPKRKAWWSTSPLPWNRSIGPPTSSKSWPRRMHSSVALDRTS